MKHLKKFENFHLEDPMSPDVDIDEQDYLDYKRKMSSVDSESEFTEEEEEGDWEYQDEIPIRRTIGVRWMKRNPPLINLYRDIWL